MVPAEGIEPPTFGLQNRCSTAELSRPMARWRLRDCKGSRFSCLGTGCNREPHITVPAAFAMLRQASIVQAVAKVG